MKKILLLVFIFLLLLSTILFLKYHLKTEAIVEKPEIINDEVFSWSDNFEAEYISFSDWKLEKSEGQEIDCPETEEVSRIKIGEQDYCLKAFSEGAAGSVYTNYSYSTHKDGEVITLKFVARYPQCYNYDDPKKSDCEFERETFKLNQKVADLLNRLDWIDLAGTCNLNGGKWLEEYRECEGLDKTWCLENNGIFKDCESVCRHDSGAQVCNLQCVFVCELNN